MTNDNDYWNTKYKNIHINCITVKLFYFIMMKRGVFANQSVSLA